MDANSVQIEMGAVSGLSTLKIVAICLMLGLGVAIFDGLLRTVLLGCLMLTIGMFVFVRFTAETSPLVLTSRSITHGKTQIDFADLRDIVLIDTHAWDEGSRNALIRADRLSGVKIVIPLGSYTKNPAVVAAIEDYLAAISKGRPDEIRPSLQRIRELVEGRPT